MPDAVVFDLDGVLLDSEQLWNVAKEAVVREHGGHWPGEAAETMLGMSSPEWSAYMRDELGVPLTAERINDLVVEHMTNGYREELPLLPGAAGAVRRLADRWPLGLASSANREIIDAFLELSGLGDSFRVTLSSEQVERGKPSPDVYLEVLSQLGVDRLADRGDRGLRQRDQGRRRCGHDRDRDPQSALPAGRRPRPRRRGGGDAGRPHSRVARGGRLIDSRR